jgi:hypothetical protein
MNKILGGFVIILAVLCNSCGGPSVPTPQPPVTNKHYEELTRDLPLKKLLPTSRESKEESGYFLFLKEGSDTHLYISFPHFDQWYTIKRPLTHFKMEFDETVEFPTIRFQFWGLPREKTDTYFESKGGVMPYLSIFLSTMTIKCRPEQWLDDLRSSPANR